MCSLRKLAKKIAIIETVRPSNKEKRETLKTTWFGNTVFYTCAYT